VAEPVVTAEVAPAIEAAEEVAEPEVAEAPAEAVLPVSAAADVDDLFREVEEELAAPSGAKDAPEQTEIDRFVEPERMETAGPAHVPVGKPEEAEQVTDEQKKKLQKPGEVTPPAGKDESQEPIEVFDLEEVPAKPEEQFEILEEEPAEKPSAPAPASAPVKGKAPSLEEEMAELFGEEHKESAAEVPAAAPVAKGEEDFDLSVFQKEKQEAEEAEPEALPEEALFEVDKATQSEEDAVQEVTGVQSASRIKALAEEKTPMSVHLFTAAVILSFGAVALVGMMLWHIFVVKR
jgi:hypothetical protein